MTSCPQRKIRPKKEERKIGQSKSTQKAKEKETTQDERFGRRSSRVLYWSLPGYDCIKLGFVVGSYKTTEGSSIAPRTGNERQEKGNSSGGVVHSKKSSYTPKKIRKSEKKQKIQGIFLRILNLYTLFGSEQLLEFSVKSFFIYKILVHQNKNSKNRKKIGKIQRFFWGFKIRASYLGVNNPSISVFKSFFFIKSSHTQKNKEKIKKNPKQSEKN